MLPAIKLQAKEFEYTAIYLDLFECRFLLVAVHPWNICDQHKIDVEKYHGFAFSASNKGRLQ